MEALNRQKLLEAMEKNAKLSARDLAVSLNFDEEAVAEEIEKLEKEKIIRGYHTLVDWDKSDDSKVSAVIEISIAPQQGNGYDKIAEKIYSYPEVVSMYLVSGNYDYLVTLHNATMRDIANFVASKIAIIDGVKSAATHFVMLRYKEHGCAMGGTEKRKREMVASL